jgi:hypothetical protein
MTLMTPLLEMTPVSGFDVRSARTERVDRLLCDWRQPQHSVNC